VSKKKIFITVLVVTILATISVNYALSQSDQKQDIVALPPSVTGVVLKDYKIAGKLNPNKELMVFLSLKLRNKNILNL